MFNVYTYQKRLKEMESAKSADPSESNAQI